MRRLIASLSLLAGATALLPAAAPQQIDFFPVDEVRPGMQAVGRTVFAGTTVEDFQVEILGVLRNVMGPRRDLVLARLSGGPLAETGVMQGMSGSPVYIDGRLLGAVSYSLGSFPREAIAGITPIAGMIADTTTPGAQAPQPTTIGQPLALEDVRTQLRRLFGQHGAPAAMFSGSFEVVGPMTLRDLLPSLRPIGVALAVSGLDPTLTQAFSDDTTQAASQAALPAASGERVSLLRPGDAVGMSLVRGDLEMGATGTVTHVEGDRVYAFGHPFLNLGPTEFAMTQASVRTLLPSLDSSMKITAMGPVIGTMDQDRFSGVGGRIGRMPHELDVRITMTSSRAPAEQHFAFKVLRDATLTPLFAYVAVFNALIGQERQSGPLSIAARGQLTLETGDTIDIDNFFSGDFAIAEAATSVTAAIGPAVTNPFRSVMPERLDLRFDVREDQQSSTIERIWLDTIRPTVGGTHTLSVLMRDYRGATRTIEIPVQMPGHVSGPVTLVVGDSTAATRLDQGELQPAVPTSWAGLLERLGRQHQNHTLYVRLVAASVGTAVNGKTLPALPPSIRSVLDSDTSMSTRSVAKTLLGSWERRLDLAVRGSRELSLQLADR